VIGALGIALIQEAGYAKINTASGSDRSSVNKFIDVTTLATARGIDFGAYASRFTGFYFWKWKKSTVISRPVFLEYGGGGIAHILKLIKAKRKQSESSGNSRVSFGEINLRHVFPLDTSK